MGVLLRAFWGMNATAGVDCAALLVVFLVFCLVTMPVGDSGDSTLDLVPGADVAAALDSGGSLWQVIGNVLLLGPLGALLPLRIRRLRALLRIALAALIASVLVEGTQYLIHSGRVTSTDDVVLNTAGAMLGAAIAHPERR